MRLLISLAVVATSVFGCAQAPLTPQQALERLFTERPAKAEWFSPEFLRAVPLEQIETILTTLPAQLGRFENSRPMANFFAASFERGVVPSQIVLDAQGRIAGLFFSPPRPRLTGLKAIVAELGKSPGKLSLLVREGPNERVSVNPDERLAVGSAFKMAVLEALRAEIQAGKRRWTHERVLEDRFRSFSSAGLERVPGGTRLSLQRLADLMISVSDNTATDMLIAALGREQVERYSEANRPFLTTREAFQLKSPVNRALLERYRAADLSGKRQILTELAALPLPPLESFAQPLALDIEWFFSTRELCDLIGRVQDLPSMRLNPGLASRDTWPTVAYKGGSEPGVLNLTTYLAGKTGKTYCVSTTFVNPDSPLDENGLVYLYTLLLEALAAG